MGHSCDPRVASASGGRSGQLGLRSANGLRNVKSDPRLRLRLEYFQIRQEKNVGSVQTKITERAIVKTAPSFKSLAGRARIRQELK
jgi:hypothetical protein